MKIKWQSPKKLQLPNAVSEQGKVFDVPADFAMHVVFKGYASLAEEKVKVRFTRDYTKMGYLTGNTATLHAKDAEALLKGGYIHFIEDVNDYSNEKVKIKILSSTSAKVKGKMETLRQGEFYYVSPETAKLLLSLRKAELAKEKAIKVKFLKTVDFEWKTYMAGNTYELEHEKAVHLISRGLAEPVETIE